MSNDVSDATRTLVSVAVFCGYIVGLLVLATFLGRAGVADGMGYLLLYSLVVTAGWFVAKRTKLGKYLWDVPQLWM